MYKDMKSFGRAWVKALRSEEYEQCSGALMEVGDKSDSFCCLGVAFDLLATADGQRFWWEGNCGTTENKQDSADLLSFGEDLPPWLRDWLRKKAVRDGERKNMESHLINMNDYGSKFAEIADFIEKKL